jgi:predicted PurR-regulated permease PerM
MIVVIAAVSFTGALGWVVAKQLIEVVNHLPAYRENIHSKMLGIRAPATGALGRAAKSVEQLTEELAVPNGMAQAASATGTKPLPVRLVTTGPNMFVYLRDLTGPFVAPMEMTGFVLILTIFILIKREDLRDRLLHLIGVSQMHVTTQALDDATQRVSRYLALQLLVNGMMGVAVWAGLQAIGVPYAPLWGVIAAILRIVPYLGIFSAALLPFTLSLAVFDGWLQPALVFVLFFALEIIVGNFVEPWLYGAHTGISSLGLLVSAIFWTILWSYPGLILSTPLTVCVVVLGRYVPHLSFLHVMLGDQPVLTTEIRLYQRLLAMDQAEARAVIDGVLKDRPLLDLYDLVLIPVLIMAEQDRHTGTLEPHRQEFLFLCLTELIAELAAHIDASVNGDALSRTGRVFLIPARDDADELAAVMFSQLLEHAGCPVVSFPAGTAQDLECVRPSAEDTICVSALTPFAFAAAAKLCTRLHAAYPRAKIVAGIWGFPEGKESLLDRLEQSNSTTVATTLAQGLEQIAPKDFPALSRT